jgi:hypothetical protein
MAKAFSLSVASVDDEPKDLESAAALEKLWFKTASNVNAKFVASNCLDISVSIIGVRQL